MGRNLKATISRTALRHNLERVREISSGAKVLAMVKANAYGHGLSAVSHALSKADALGVACIEEALMLRQDGITQQIVLMEGFFNREEFSAIEAFDLSVVLHSFHQLNLMLEHSFEKTVPVWIKLNTGMNRLGFPPDQATHIYERLKENPKISLIGWMSHFPQADEKDNALTLNQYQLFKEYTKDLPGAKSCANSAGILGWQISHEDWVRPGLMLYGASPFEGTIGEDFGLKCSMTLSSKVISIQDLKPGDRVGYGGTWQCQKPTKVAIIAAGYGDGYPWHAANGTPVLVRDKRLPLVGRVSMDMIAVDISTHDAVEIGDKVMLWGPHLPVEEVAYHAKTVPWELFCRLTERVHIEWCD